MRVQSIKGPHRSQSLKRLFFSTGYKTCINFCPTAFTSRKMVSRTGSSNVLTSLIGIDDVPATEADPEEVPEGAESDPSSTTLSLPSPPKISSVADGPDVGAADGVVIVVAPKVPYRNDVEGCLGLTLVSSDC